MCHDGGQSLAVMRHDLFINYVHVRLTAAIHSKIAELLITGRHPGEYNTTTMSDTNRCAGHFCSHTA